MKREIISLLVLSMLLFASSAMANEKWKQYGSKFDCADMEIPSGKDRHTMTTAVCTSEAVSIAHRVVFGRDIDSAASVDIAMVVSTEMDYYGMPTYGQLEERLERELSGSQYSINVQPLTAPSRNDLLIKMGASSLGAQLSTEQVQAARQYLVAAGGGSNPGWFRRFLTWLNELINGVQNGTQQGTVRPTPPAVTPPTPQPDVNTYRRYQLPPNSNSHREFCFGAIGPQCNGGAPGAPVTMNPDGSYVAWVSVGAILHDTCCLEHPDGLHCKGADWLSMVTDFPDDGQVCAMEWRKAVWNLGNGRMWQVIYGPYTQPGVVDNLTPSSSTRRTVSLFDRWGGSTKHSYSERVATRLLYAPRGTYLDIDDVQFCQSGRFVQTWGSMPGNSAYGKCE